MKSDTPDRHLTYKHALREPYNTHTYTTPPWKTVDDVKASIGVLRSLVYKGKAFSCICKIQSYFISNSHTRRLKTKSFEIVPDQEQCKT